MVPADRIAARIPADADAVQPARPPRARADGGALVGRVRRHQGRPRHRHRHVRPRRHPLPHRGAGVRDRRRSPAGRSASRAPPCRGIVVGGALGVAVYQLTLNEGALRTTAGVTSLIIASCPALTLLIARMTGLERLTPTRLGGIALAFAGIAVVAIWAPGQSLELDHLAGPAVGARGVAGVGGLHHRHEAGPRDGRQPRRHGRVDAGGRCLHAALRPVARRSTRSST